MWFDVRVRDIVTVTVGVRVRVRWPEVRCYVCKCRVKSQVRGGRSMGQGTRVKGQGLHGEYLAWFGYKDRQIPRATAKGQ